MRVTFRPFALLLAGAYLVAPIAAEAGPWEDLMGEGKPQIWTDPKSRFYLDLPVGWKAKPNPDYPVVDFWKQHPDYGHTARVSVEMRTLPPNVNTRHFALSHINDIKKRAPQFRMIKESRLRVSGVPAVRMHFTFQERNNVALVNEVTQVILIVGERAFIITLQTAFGAREIFLEDFKKMVKGFTGRAPGEESRPTPRQRKRVKSGEMVNPDAVGY